MDVILDNTEDNDDEEEGQEVQVPHPVLPCH